MRIVFMGTPAFAIPVLDELVRRGHEVAAVYTRAPAPGGRGMAETLSPVHVRASALGLPVRHPQSLRGEEASLAFRALGADVAVVVAYGLILPRSILDAPRLGCLNLHASLLPRWRGAAPIQRAVMAADPRSGVAVMRMEAGLDTGPIALERILDITPDMTAGDLHDALAPIGAALMGEAMLMLEGGSLSFTPQSRDGVSYAHKIDKAECRVDWNRPARLVAAQIQGLSPFPGAFFEVEVEGGSGRERIKVSRARAREGTGPPGTVLDHHLGVACAEGVVELLRLQRAGKAPLGADAFLRGMRLPPGTRLDLT